MLEYLDLEWKRSSSYLASDFIGLSLLRDSRQADIVRVSASNGKPCRLGHGAATGPLSRAIGQWPISPRRTRDE
jgi:hypothetical protein